ncbi:hypothetical protein D5086_030074 [Populus alba]|uniref:Uncharacterized protein n=1 Tax=Populus alba TaxID=43335 RepID=A0ACC4AND6_POPAL
MDATLRGKQGSTHLHNTKTKSSSGAQRRPSLPFLTSSHRHRDRHIGHRHGNMLLLYMLSICFLLNYMTTAHLTNRKSIKFFWDRRLSARSHPKFMSILYSARAENDTTPHQGASSATARRHLQQLPSLP